MTTHLRALTAVLATLSLGGCSLLIGGETTCKTDPECTSPAICLDGVCTVVSAEADAGEAPPDAGQPDAGPSTIVLSVDLSSANPVAGQAVSLTVTAKDPAGATVVDYRGSVKLSTSDGKATLPAAFLFAAADKGTHTFANAVTFRTAGPQTLTATDEASAAITGKEDTTVLAGQAQALSVTGIPAFVVAGAPQSVTVTALDASGNVAAGYRGTVQFSSSDAKAGLPPSYTFLAEDEGTRTFADALSLRTAGTHSVIATDTAAASVNGTQADIVVGPGAAAALKVGGVPSPIDAGSSASLTVSAADAFGNAVSAYSGTVHLTSTDARAVLPADYTFTGADSGTHTFPNLVLRSVGNWSVTATDTAVASITGVQAGIDVRLGAPAQLVFVQAPVAAQVNVTLSPPITVAIRDLGGNAVTSATNTITLALGVNPSAATLTGTLFHDAVAGVATFANLKLDKQGTGYTLRATSGGLAAAETPAFDASGCPVGYTGASCTDCIAGYHHPTSDPSKCVDACLDPNPCSAPPAKTCSGNTAVTYTVPGACTTSAAAPYFACDYTPVNTACTGGKVCYQGDCVADPCVTNPCVADESSCSADAVTLTTYSATCTPLTATTRQCKTDNVASAIDCTGLAAGGLCRNKTCTTLPQPGVGEVLITEVLASPAGGAARQWFEVKNLSAKDLNLSGLQVEELSATKSFTLPASPPAVLLAGGYLVVGASKDLAQNGGAPVAAVWPAAFDLPAAGQLALKAGATVVEDLDYRVGFPNTSGAAMNLSSSLLLKSASPLAWYWCDASKFVTGASGEKGTPGAANDDCGVPASPVLTWCAVQFPLSLPAGEALVATEIYGRMFGAGVTDRNTIGNDAYPFVHGEVGFGAAKDPSGWTWAPAGFTPGYVAPTNDPDKNNDEMMASVTFPAAGTYYYGYRFHTTDSAGANPAYVYCGVGAGSVVDPATPSAWDAFPVATVTFTGKSTSAQLAAVRAAVDDAAVTLPVQGATVTYVKAAFGTGTDGAGFFVQGEPAGPALYVAVDPASLTPAPAAGDKVGFTVTKKLTSGALPYVSTLSGWARAATGEALAPFLKDGNAATDLVTGLDGYAAKPLAVTAHVSGPFLGGGGAFLSAPITTAGLPTGDPSLVLRLPFDLQYEANLVPGCALALSGAPMWRFNAAAQVSAWSALDYTVSGCPQPKVAAAFARSATSVVVEFTRSVAAASVLPDGSQFTLDNGATVSAAALTGKTVVLTTSALATGTDYQVGVAATVQDLQGSAMDPAGSTFTFPGPGAACVAPQVVISQIYGGGGNVGAPYQNDFVELHNRGDTDVSLAGWSLQYAAKTSASWTAVNLSGTLAAGGYLLVQGASGAAGVALPTADVTSSVNLSATDGKVLLSTAQTAHTTNCPKVDADVVDFVGYGAADCQQGASSAPVPTNPAAAARLGQGCVSTSDNGADFVVLRPVPRNSSAPAVACGCL